MLDYDEVANINHVQMNLLFHENELGVELIERTANVKVSFKGLASR